VDSQYYPHSERKTSFFIPSAFFILPFLGYQILHSYEFIEYNLPCRTGCIEFHDLTGGISFLAALWVGVIAFVCAALVASVAAILRVEQDIPKYFQLTFDSFYVTLLFLFLFFNSLSIKISEFFK
jgi:hypothetical protein